MGTGGTARYYWNFPICPTRVTIDLSVIRALQKDLESAGERHGLLYGKESDGATHINGREAIGGRGRDEIEDAIANAKRPPVGYYRIRDGRAFILTSEEIEIGTEVFQRPGSLMLLIERRGAAAAEATFFFRRGGSFVHNLPLPFPLDAERLAAGDGAASLPPPGVKPRRSRVTMRRAAAMAAGAAMGIGFAAMAMRNPAHPPAPSRTPPALARPAAVEPARSGGELEFVWDPKSMPAATAGLLEIDDGGVRRSIPLDGEQLKDGRLAYVPNSERVKVELSTLQRDGRIVDENVSVRPASNSAHVPASVVEPVAQPPLSPAPPPKQSEPLPPAPRKAADAAPPSSADRKVPPKPFQLALGRVETAPATSIVLDPPAVEMAPAGGAPLPISPALHAVAPPPAPTAPKRFVAPAGRLIWTGTLTRRGVVELDGRAASVGSISGALPGVPVNVSISPAEFDGDALVVYTTDAARNNRVEPASAATGWNKVKWVWDPVRVGEIAVLEPPNQSNGFNRLAFRNDARRTSIVWIDWRAR